MRSFCGVHHGDQLINFNNFSPTSKYSLPSFLMIHLLEFSDFNAMARSVFKSFLSSLSIINNALDISCSSLPASRLYLVFAIFHFF